MNQWTLSSAVSQAPHDGIHYPYCNNLPVAQTWETLGHALSFMPFNMSILFYNALYLSESLIEHSLFAWLSNSYLCFRPLTLETPPASVHSTSWQIMADHGSMLRRVASTVQFQRMAVLHTIAVSVCG